MRDPPQEILDGVRRSREPLAVLSTASCASSKRRTPLDEPLDDFFFDQGYRHVLGATRPKADGSPSAQVVNLDIRRRIAALPLAGMPHLGSGITFAWKGGTVLASPNLKDGVVQVIYKTPAGVLKDRLLSRSDTDGIALATKARGGEPGASGAGL